MTEFLRGVLALGFITGGAVAAVFVAGYMGWGMSVGGASKRKSGKRA